MDHLPLRAEVDAVVIGGGFFGCSIALALRKMGLRRVVLVERERAIMQRASYVNQARVHNGYHYPRSLPTAERSRMNFVRFCHDFAYALRTDFRQIYAVARNSSVNASQFERFCHEIQAPCHTAPRAVERLFDSSLIAASYVTREVAFDTAAIRRAVERAMHKASIEVVLQCSARIVAAKGAWVEVEGTRLPRVRTNYLFNCTYADLDLAGVALRSRVKRELTELALIEVPAGLWSLGITVVDGPFFSAIPFPAECCHSLSHVRYTPHSSWVESHRADVLPTKTNWQFMLRDAARYVPSLAQSTYRRSLFELKAVLEQNEDNDGRPILFEHSAMSSRLISVMGGKIDNIYDVLEWLRTEEWARGG
jgi:glycine/D-amino acid oxidase-like deaminating enzyme